MINKMLKPIVKWSGGKSDELGQIIPHVPETFDHYLEPFAGGAALLFALQHDKNVISDVHVELVRLYEQLKEGNGPSIATFMKEYPNDEATYYHVRDKMEIVTNFDTAKRFYYLRKTCYRGMLRYNKKGGFNIPFGRYKTCNSDELLNPLYQKVLGNTSIHCEPFKYVFEHYGNNPNNFMFLDPPYDSEFTDYGYCKFGKDEHRELAECFKKAKCKMLMIIGRTPFIADLYSDYIVGEYDKRYRFKLHSGRVDDKINTTHLIIKNY